MLPASPALVPRASDAPAQASGFLRRHLGWPLLAVLAASAELMAGGGNQWLADQLYRMEGHHWLLQNGVFGAAQQLRGAHFLSHDLWTLATCWTVSLLLFLVVRRITARGVRA